MNQPRYRAALPLLLLLVSACATPIKLPLSFDNTTPGDHSPVVIKGPVLPPAAFFTDNAHLLREYFSRSKTTPPSLDGIAENLLGGKTPLTISAAKYLRDPDAFKRRDYAPVFTKEVESVLLSGETVPAVAIWHNIYIGPYDFQTREFKVCFQPDCSPLPGNQLRSRYGTRDYELVVQGIPASFLVEPNEADAREIEHAASMQTPRGMPVLLIAEFPRAGSSEDAPLAGQLKANIAGIRIYRRSSFGVRTDIPPRPEGLFLTVEVSPEKFPVVSHPPTQPSPGLQSNSEGQTDRIAVASHTANPVAVTDLLFRNMPEAARLSKADKVAIAKLLPLAVGTNGLVDTACNHDSYVRVTLRDLNHDNQMEVIVTEGNACVYGVRGGVTHFLTKVSDGKWREVLAGDGDAIAPPNYKIFSAKPGQWADVMPGVRGFCYPIYAYSRPHQKYLLKRKIADKSMPNACSPK